MLSSHLGTSHGSIYFSSSVCRDSVNSGVTEEEGALKHGYRMFRKI